MVTVRCRLNADASLGTTARQGSVRPPSRWPERQIRMRFDLPQNRVKCHTY